MNNIIKEVMEVMRPYDPDPNFYYNKYLHLPSKRGFGYHELVDYFEKII